MTVASLSLSMDRVGEGDSVVRELEGSTESERFVLLVKRVLERRGVRAVVRGGAVCCLVRGGIESVRAKSH